jgi:hypothetical protein
MKKQLNEIKRIQQLAGIIKEGMEDWGSEKDDYGNSEEDYSPEPTIEDFDGDQEAYEAAYQYWLRKKKGSSEVNESSDIDVNSEEFKIAGAEMGYAVKALLNANKSKDEIIKFCSDLSDYLKDKRFSSLAKKY